MLSGVGLGINDLPVFQRLAALSESDATSTSRVNGMPPGNVRDTTCHDFLSTYPLEQ